MSTALTPHSQPANVAGVPPAPSEGSPKSSPAGVPPRQWRYSLRWGNPYTQPPGAAVLAEALVPAGAACPPEVQALWRPGAGYAICIDFDDLPYELMLARKWSPERKGKVRVKRLENRIAKAFPLFADELIQRELAARPDYYRGTSPR